MLHKVHDLFRLRTSPVVFFVSAAIIAVFIIVTLIIPTQMGNFWGAGSGWLYDNMGWFYTSGVTIFLLFLIWMAVGRFGRMKLGDDEEKPEHSDITWFGMLFAAGIGTILMFWAVAEPANHFENPPRGAQEGIEGGTPEAASEAMGFTLFHFGLHTWTIFALPGLAFAYFIYKRKLPRASPRYSSRCSATESTGPLAKASTSSPSSAPSSAWQCPSAWVRCRSTLAWHSSSACPTLRGPSS